jgi:hypothetical protein
MEQSGSRQASKMTHPKEPRIGFDAVVPNPKLGLMDEVRDLNFERPTFNFQR